jgi:GNAT superfamily N-acetyltransferase
LRSVTAASRRAIIAAAMTFELREPRAEELAALSELCLRSKAVWGYDAAFMAACQHELTLTASDLETSRLQVAAFGNVLVGVVQVSVSGCMASLEKLFVDPCAMRTGAGRALFAWASGVGAQGGAASLVIESDPGAAGFYRRMGARDDGVAPSESIPGRFLPKLVLDLR